MTLNASHFVAPINLFEQLIKLLHILRPLFFIIFHRMIVMNHIFATMNSSNMPRQLTTAFLLSIIKLMWTCIRPTPHVCVCVVASFYIIPNKNTLTKSIKYSLMALFTHLNICKMLLRMPVDQKTTWFDSHACDVSWIYFCSVFFSPSLYLSLKRSFLVVWSVLNFLGTIVDVSVWPKHNTDCMNF